MGGKHAVDLLISRFILAAGLTLTTLAARAQIATDGTVGPAQRLSGPDYAIGAGLGTQVGANLFHSFATFNLHGGESATFSGPTGLHNVISRVTGGELSMIDGTLRSEIAGANFFFVNPAGMIFGANARVDVPAAFHVSAADEVRFADGSVFSAADPGLSTLSAAAPEAFGFLGPHRGRIGFEGSRLTFAPGSRVTVSAGEIAIRDGTLVVEGGELALTALGETTGAVPVDGAFAGDAAGDLTVERSTLNVSGAGGGGLWVQGGALQITDSGLFNDNTGDQDAAHATEIRARSLVLDGSLISNATTGAGRAGDVTVAVAGDATIQRGAVIGSQTVAGGRAGDVTVRARNVLIDGLGSPTITGIVSQARKGSSGAGGNILVTVGDSLILLNGGVIGAGTFDAGDAGNVAVSAGNLLIDGLDSPDFTGIASNAESGSTGAGGEVTVTVIDTLTVRNGGEISGGTFGAGNAGNVIIRAGNLLIDDLSSEYFTGIASSAGRGSTGAGGGVNLTVAGTLTVRNGGEIRASAFGAGNAGNVTIRAGNLLIDGLDSLDFTGIGSSAQPGATGGVAS